jgi:two-component system alkaline phosphatase synthesis response regulator PhoP
MTEKLVAETLAQEVPSNGDTNSATAGARIFIVEDQPRSTPGLTEVLENEGYDVDSGSDGTTALERLKNEGVDLIILGVMLSGKNGFQICRELRRSDIRTPILLLTVRSSVMDKVIGLKLGADDYLTKPFEVMELLARIEALLRRTRPKFSENECYSFGPIHVDPGRAKVTRNARTVELSSMEFKLLKYLVQRRSSTVTREELVKEVWGYDSMPASRTVDVHISSLRQKLEPNPKYPQYILTVHRVGYKLRN